MIGILTYNVAHRKTYDVLSLLKARGYDEVNVYAVPHHYVKKFKPIYEHRPPINSYAPDTKTMCNNLGYNYYEGQIEEFVIPEDEILLVCGAGILKEDFVKRHRIINAHPGYIPYCRGLDSFKWAIYDNLPIGVTTHLIGDYVDAGEIIQRKVVEVTANDTFHAVAQRVYENEVGMLVDAIEHINEKHEFIMPADGYDVHKRMPNEYELVLMEKFERYVHSVNNQAI